MELPLVQVLCILNYPLCFILAQFEFYTDLQAQNMDYHLVVPAQGMDDFFISFWDAVGVRPMVVCIILVLFIFLFGTSWCSNWWWLYW